VGYEVVEVNTSDSRNASDKGIKGGISGKVNNRVKELVTNTPLGLGAAASPGARGGRGRRHERRHSRGWQ